MTIEVHWPRATCPECEEVFDGVSIADDEAFELHNEFECPGRESGGNTVPVTDGVKGIIGGPRPGPNCHLWSD